MISWMQDQYSGVKSRAAGIDGRLQTSTFGRAVRKGTMESFGYNFNSAGQSVGFLGSSSEGAGWSSQAKMNSATKNLYKTAPPRTPGIKGAAGRGGGKAFGLLGKSLGLLGTAYFAYQGYQQEGAWGAAKGIGESVGSSIAFSYAASLLGPAGVAGLAGAAVVGGTYMLGEAGREHAKSLRQLEMGGGDQMQQAIGSAGAATARQRSLHALNNSHLNSRMALGNEAFLMHRAHR